MNGWLSVWETIYCNLLMISWVSCRVMGLSIMLRARGIGWLVRRGYVAETEIQLMYGLGTLSTHSNYENWLQIAMIMWRQHSECGWWVNKMTFVVIYLERQQCVGEWLNEWVSWYVRTFSCRSLIGKVKTQVHQRVLHILHVPQDA